MSSLNPFPCKIQIFKVRVKVPFFLRNLIFSDFSQENHSHGGHEHGVRSGVFSGGKLSFKKMSTGGRLRTLQDNSHFWIPTIKVRPPDGISSCMHNTSVCQKCGDWPCGILKCRVKSLMGNKNELEIPMPSWLISDFCNTCSSSNHLPVKWGVVGEAHDVDHADDGGGTEDGPEKERPRLELHHREEIHDVLAATYLTGNLDEIKLRHVSSSSSYFEKAGWCISRLSRSVTSTPVAKQDVLHGTGTIGQKSHHHWRSSWLEDARGSAAGGEPIISRENWTRKTRVTWKNVMKQTKSAVRTLLERLTFSPSVYYFFR